MPISRQVALAALILLVPGLIAGCGGGDGGGGASSGPPVCSDCIWREATAQMGVTFTHSDARSGVTDYLPQTMGPGVAATDFDGDGLLDLFFVQGAGDAEARVLEPAAHLYRRDAVGARFEEVAGLAGVLQRGCGQAVLAVDHDNDGYSDLLVTRYWASNLLYRNNGDGSFTESAAAAGAAGLSRWTSFATAIDRDRDGLNDLYVGNYLDFRPEHWVKDPTWTARDQGKYLDTMLPGPYGPERKLLLANQGGRFTDVTAAAGAANPEGKGLGALAADLDDDGWPDLFVANDVSPCALLWNQKNGAFKDVARAAYVGESRGSMGLALGDFDADLKGDVLVSHWVADIPALYLRVSKSGRQPLYADRARGTVLASYPVDLSGWATAFLDVDNDGQEGVLVINGHTNPPSGQRGKLIAQTPILLSKHGTKLAFRPGGSASDVLSRPMVGRGGVFCDLDHDGTTDLAMACNNQPASVWLHRPLTAAWLDVIPVGTGSNRDGIGARVELLDGTGAVSRVEQVVSGDSYYSSNPYRVHFGLGSSHQPVTLRLTWLCGRVEEFAGLAPRKQHRLVEGTGRTVRAPAG